MSAVLAIFAAPRADTPEATEFLRIAAALLAVGRQVRLLEAGRGVGVLTKEDPELTEDGARYLDGLKANGVAPAPWPNAMPAALVIDGVMRLGDPDRPGEPRLLEVGRGRTELGALLAAGQVLWGPAVPTA